MKKFLSHTSPQFVKKLRFSYLTCRPYLDFAAYVFPRHQEEIIVLQDLLFPHEWPALTLPRKKINWERASIGFATPNEIAAIRAEGIPILVEKPFAEEYYYDPRHFQNPSGDLLQKIHRFTKHTAYTLRPRYPKKKILAFYRRWKKQKSRNGIVFQESEDFFQYCLDRLSRYAIRQVYVEVQQHLVGFAWGYSVDAKHWVGLEAKADYSYPGLSRFLQFERAKLFPKTTECTLGSGVHEPGIAAFKHELGPQRTVPYTYILTDAKP